MEGKHLSCPSAFLMSQGGIVLLQPARCCVELEAWGPAAEPTRLYVESEKQAGAFHIVDDQGQHRQWEEGIEEIW